MPGILAGKHDALTVWEKAGAEMVDGIVADLD